MDFSKEYSEEFDSLRKNRVRTSFYKYGSAAQNFGNGYVQAIPTLERCLEKYKETGNTEYLCDLANYAMFEFMYPNQRLSQRSQSTNVQRRLCEVRVLAKVSGFFRRKKDIPNTPRRIFGLRTVRKAQGSLG